MIQIKSIFILFLLIFAIDARAQSTFEKWPAIKTFHSVMSQTFHPSEEGNLEPIKLRSQEMVDKAEALLIKEIPAEFKTNSILAAVEKLQIKSKILHKMIVLKASDATITKNLSELHDVFHDIVGLCSSEKH